MNIGIWNYFDNNTRNFISLHLVQGLLYLPVQFHDSWVVLVAVYESLSWAVRLEFETNWHIFYLAALF